MNEIQNEPSDDGVSGDALGDLNIFNPGYSLITWPKDKEYDQKQLNLFFFKRLDNLIVSTLKGLNENKLKTIRFMGYRDLKQKYSSIIETVIIKSLKLLH